MELELRPELDLANLCMNRGDPFSNAKPIGNEVNGAPQERSMVSCPAMLSKGPCVGLHLHLGLQGVWPVTSPNVLL